MMDRVLFEEKLKIILGDKFLESSMWVGSGEKQNTISSPFWLKYIKYEWNFISSNINEIFRNSKFSKINIKCLEGKMLNTTNPRAFVNWLDHYCPEVIFDLYKNQNVHNFIPYVLIANQNIISQKDNISLNIIFDKPQIIKNHQFSIALQSEGNIYKKRTDDFVSLIKKISSFKDLSYYRFKKDLQKINLENSKREFDEIASFYTKNTHIFVKHLESIIKDENFDESQYNISDHIVSDYIVLWLGKFDNNLATAFRFRYDNLLKLANVLNNTIARNIIIRFVYEYKTQILNQKLFSLDLITKFLEESNFVKMHYQKGNIHSHTEVLKFGFRSISWSILILVDMINSNSINTKGQ